MSSFTFVVFGFMVLVVSIWFGQQLFHSQQTSELNTPITFSNPLEGLPMIEIVIAIIAIILIALSIKTVRPTERAIVERMGKYKSFWEQGIHFAIPFIDNVILVNTTERMVTAQPQEIITKDSLNAEVDAQIYFRVQGDETSIKNSQYNVNDYETQIVSLIRTTLRNLIGQMEFRDVNNQRGVINATLANELNEQIKDWGIQVVRAELKEIQPPKDVQETMNNVLKAQNTKTASIDFATAQETQADGAKRSAIKQAEGIAQAILLKATADKKATILKAEGDAEAIKLVNESADKYFVGNAVNLEKLKTASKMFRKNSKIIVSEDTPLLEMVSKLSAVMQKDKK